MTTSAADSPASLYGVPSLVLGVFALTAAVFIGIVGLLVPVLFGGLAVTFAAFGLSKRLNRGKCVIGLTTGGLAVLYPVFLLATFGG